MASSVSTVRTVDDVLSIVDSKLGDRASLSESRKYIRKITATNKVLRNEAISEIEDISNLLCAITHNVAVLVNLMAKTGALLGGVQATSFFYPMCGLVDAPWDIFCNVRTADEFVTGYLQSSGAEIVEDVRADNGTRVVHLRKSVSGFSLPASVRILVSNADPMCSILNLKNTYEQSIVSPAGAICFWPKLMQREIHRVFKSNTGTAEYPRGKTFYEVRLNPTRETRLRKPMESPEVSAGLGPNTETVMFKNTCNIDKNEYSLLTEILKCTVFCTFNYSTRYLGDIAGME